MTEMLNNYFDDIEALSNTKQKDLLSAVQLSTKNELSKEAVDRLERDYGKTQIGLFENETVGNEKAQEVG